MLPVEPLKNSSHQRWDGSWGAPLSRPRVVLHILELLACYVMSHFLSYKVDCVEKVECLLLKNYINCDKTDKSILPTRGKTGILKNNICHINEKSCQGL